MLIIINEINEIDAIEIRIEYHSILNRSIVYYIIRIEIYIVFLP
jgi:hypothetical protein